MTFPNLDAAYSFYMESLADKPEALEQWRM
jgi:hypothetical protein